MIFLFIFFTVSAEDKLSSAEKELAETAAKNYLNLFTKRDWKELSKVTHKSVFEQLKENSIGSLPKKTSEVTKENKEKVDNFLEILKVKSVEEAHSMKAEEVYLRMMDHSDKMPHVEFMKKLENKVHSIKVKKAEGVYIVRVDITSKLNDLVKRGISNIHFVKEGKKLLFIGLKKEIVH